MAKNFDVVVVGAGPSGAAAAFSARQAGLSVALLDKADFPRPKLCGGMVSGRGLKALDAIFGARPDDALVLVGQQVAWLWRGEELARFKAPYPLWFTGRYSFDHDLQQKALAAGAADYSARRWCDLDLEASQIHLDGGEVLGFRALIAADGATSPIAARLFGRAFDPDKIGFTLEAECQRPEAGEPLMEVDFRAGPGAMAGNFPSEAR